MGIEKLTNDIRKLLSSKKAFNHEEFLSLVRRAGYRTIINGDEHLEFYRGNEALTNEDGVAITLSNSNKKMDSLGKYRRILGFILDEIEEY
ncbi:hypothetical protein HYT25_00540 [Candidatus Pacearchaeota archaeon]|nr:hypothetical protein [Candidatus Pacearchaeota archaeon]